MIKALVFDLDGTREQTDRLKAAISTPFMHGRLVSADFPPGVQIVIDASVLLPKVIEIIGLGRIGISD